MITHPNRKKDDFCSFCGTRLLSPSYPKECRQCERLIWQNPTPVALCIQPIHDGDKRGLAYAQRAIEPMIGSWALFAGHIEYGEDIVEGAKREFWEESAIEMGHNPRIIDSDNNQHGYLLCVVMADPILFSVWKNARCCPENLAIGTLWEPEELAFPIHNKYVKLFFDGKI